MSTYIVMRDCIIVLETSDKHIPTDDDFVNIDGSGKHIYLVDENDTTCPHGENCPSYKFKLNPTQTEIYNFDVYERPRDGSKVIVCNI